MELLDNKYKGQRMKKLLMLLSLFLGFSSMQAMDFLKTKTGRIGSFIVLAGVTYGIYNKYFKGAAQLPATAASKPAETSAKQNADASAMSVAKPVEDPKSATPAQTSGTPASGPVVIDPSKPTQVQVAAPRPAPSAAPRQSVAALKASIVLPAAAATVQVDQRPELLSALKPVVLADINAGLLDDVVLKKYGQYKLDMVALKKEAAEKLAKDSISKKLEPIVESPTNSKPLPNFLKPQIRNAYGSGVPKVDLIAKYSQYTDAKQFINSL